MEFGGLVEPEIMRFFDDAQADPHPWQTEAGRAIEAHRLAAWAMDLPADLSAVALAKEEACPLLSRPTPLQYPPDGPPHAALRCGPTTSERTRARQQAEAQMAEAQKLWEACATEESWAARGE